MDNIVIVDNAIDAYSNLFELIIKAYATGSFTHKSFPTWLDEQSHSINQTMVYSQFKKLYRRISADYQTAQRFRSLFDFEGKNCIDSFISSGILARCADLNKGAYGDIEGIIQTLCETINEDEIYDDGFLFCELVTNYIKDPSTDNIVNHRKEIIDLLCEVIGQDSPLSEECDESCTT